MFFEQEYIVFENFTDITAASKLYYFAHKHGLSEALEVFSGRTLKVSVPIKNEFYGIKIDELILSTRTINILKKNKITTLGKLIAKIQNGQLRSIKNIGAKTVSEIQICVLNFCYGELDYLQKIYFFEQSEKQIFCSFLNLSACSASMKSLLSCKATDILFTADGTKV